MARPVWRNIMLLVGLVLVGMALANFLAFGVLYLCYPKIPTNLLNNLIQNPELYPNSWNVLMAIQAIFNICSFLLPALVYWRIGEQYEIKPFLQRPRPQYAIILLTLLLVVAIMPFNSWIIEWNAKLKLPSAFAVLENLMRTEEDRLAEMTQFMTNFNHIWQLFVAILVMAVVAAVGEEVLFRGIIQRKFFTKTKNKHIAIWVSAILFSGIHLQFYGFVPRMLLGAMFGYLYMWTANLWIPIIAHFFNNSVTILMLYLEKQNIIDYKITTAPWPIMILSLVVTGGILLKIKEGRYKMETNERLNLRH